MDEIYRDVYMRLYRAGVRLPLFGLRPELSTRAARSAIEAAEREMLERRNITCRPDAKLLLLANFSAMVLAPLQMTARIPIRELEQIVAEDIRMLMNDAEPDADREISAHAVITALDRNWRNLKTSSFKIWE